MKVRLVFLFVSILFSSCQPSTYLQYEIKTSHDNFDNYTVTYSHNNFIRSNNGNFLCLEMQKYQNNDGCVYSFIVLIRSNDWIFIQPGESLIFLIDGERVGLNGDGSSTGGRDVESIYGYTIREIALYNTTSELLKKIASAKEVKIKIVGSNGYEEGIFTAENFKHLKDFLRDYASN